LAGAASRKVDVCTDGVSLVPLMTKPKEGLRPGAFSQYPRYDAGTKTMGYTVASRVGGCEYRFTKWCAFKNFKVDWGDCVGVELYNHTADPAENFNVVETAEAEPVVTALLRMVKSYASGEV